MTDIKIIRKWARDYRRRVLEEGQEAADHWVQRFINYKISNQDAERLLDEINQTPNHLSGL